MSRHHGRLYGKGTKGRKIIRDNSYQTVRESQYSVMHQLAIMRPYVEQHLQELREKNEDRDEEWIMKEHKIHFTPWLRDLNLPIGETDEEMMINKLS